MQETKPNKKDALKINLDFVKDFLNISVSGISEMINCIKNSNGEVRVIMHPNNLFSRDNTKENEENNIRYENEFIPWFTKLIIKQKKSLDIDEYPPVPVILLIEENQFAFFTEEIERIFGNHLTKFGILVVPTKINEGSQTNEQTQVTKETAVKFGLPQETNIMSFANAGMPYLFHLLKIKKIVLSGGFIGEVHPEYLDIYGRCLGNFISFFLQENKKRPDKTFQIMVDSSNTFFKDGVGLDNLKLNGIAVL